MMEWITEPWPWYITGPLIGLMVPLMLLFGNKNFGVSSSLRHICAMCAPMNIDHFKYDWKKETWNLLFVIGILLGGFISQIFLKGSGQVAISEGAVAQLTALGITDFSSYVPTDIFSWQNLVTAKGIIFIAFGGFLVGFGTRYANGCTSGHSISGLANLQFGSLIATMAFFVGGLIMTHLVLPLIMSTF